MQCDKCNVNLDDGKLGFRSFDVGEEKQVTVCLPCVEGKSPIHLCCACPDGQHVEGCSIPAELERREKELAAAKEKSP